VVRARVKALLPVAAAGLTGLAVAALALTGREEPALALVGLVVAGGALIAADGWRRTRDAQHMLRLSAERQHSIAARLGAFLDDESLDAPGEDPRNSLVARLEALERRVLATLEAERLQAADDRAALEVLAAQLRETTTRQES